MPISLMVDGVGVATPRYGVPWDWKSTLCRRYEGPICSRIRVDTHIASRIVSSMLPASRVEDATESKIEIFHLIR